MISWERDEKGRLYPIRELISTATIIGSTVDKNKLKDVRDGDIWIENGEPFIRVGDKWIPLDTTTTDYSTAQAEPKTALPKVCKCCGAPLKGWECEYCGVEYG